MTQFSADKVSESTSEPLQTVELLRRIKSGEIKPNCINVETRRQLVSYLIGEGYVVAEMAKILGVSDRTIERDKVAIREEMALQSSPSFAAQVAGRLMHEADQSIQRIRRACRGRDTPVGVQVDAEYKCFRILDEMTQRLQSMGHLPTVATQLQATLTHHVGEVPGLDQLQIEIQQIEQIVSETCTGTPDGVNGEALEGIIQIKQKITRAEIADQIGQIKQDVGTTT